MVTLRLTRPDDFHLHLRDRTELASIVLHSARRFARAMIMPNLKSPVVSTVQAKQYRARILKALQGARREFEPLMTLYLTDRTRPAEIRRAKHSGIVHGVKLYPAGATTHAERGVTKVDKVYGALEAMEEAGMPLLVHGEFIDPGVDIFDREAVFIDRVLAPLLERFTKLRVVLEHVTTLQGVDFVRGGPERVAATITPQHLLYNREALFRGGLRPHLYCLPVLKRESHRRALVEAATSGHPRFFLGTDSAPHARELKEHACGCAGIFSANAALEHYADVFDAAGVLDRLEAFASINGALFYGLPRNTGTVTLEKRDWRIPKTLPFGKSRVVPLGAGETCRWKLRAA
jgi:dihydroorotase